LCGHTWWDDVEVRRLACTTIAEERGLTESLNSETAELNSLRSPEELISEANKTVCRTVDSRHAYLRQILNKSGSLTFPEAWLILSLNSGILKDQDHYPQEERLKDLAGLQSLLLLYQGQRLTKSARFIHPGVFFGFLFIGFLVLMIHRQNLGMPDSSIVFPGWALIWLVVFPLITFLLDSLYRLKCFLMKCEFRALFEVADINLRSTAKQKNLSRFWQTQIDRTGSGLKQRMQEEEIDSIALPEVKDRLRQLYRGFKRVGGNDLREPLRQPPMDHGSKLSRAFYLPLIFACTALIFPGSWYQESSEWIQNRSHPFMMAYHSKISSLSIVEDYLREKGLYEEMIQDHERNFSQYAPIQYNKAKNAVSQGSQSGNTKIRTNAYTEAIEIMDAVLGEQKELYQMRSQAENAYRQLDKVSAEMFFNQRISQIRESLERKYTSQDLEAAKNQYLRIEHEIKTLQPMIQECKELDAELDSELENANDLIQNIKQPLHSLDQEKLEGFKLEKQKIITAQRNPENLRKYVGNTRSLVGDLVVFSEKITMGHAWHQQFQILWEGIKNDREEIEQYFPESWDRIQQRLDEIERTPDSQVAGLYQTLYGEVQETITNLDQSRRKK
jgi:hypothetical protein